MCWRPVIAAAVPTAHGYATRLLTVMKSKAEPKGVADADWERTKAAYLQQRLAYRRRSRVHPIAIDCDRNLKSALPHVSKEPRTLGITYYYLGFRGIRWRKLTGDGPRYPGGETYSEKS